MEQLPGPLKLSEEWFFQWPKGVCALLIFTQPFTYLPFHRALVSCSQACRWYLPWGLSRPVVGQPGTQLAMPGKSAVGQNSHEALRATPHGCWCGQGPLHGPNPRWHPAPSVVPTVMWKSKRVWDILQTRPLTSIHLAHEGLVASALNKKDYSRGGCVGRGIFSPVNEST